uniref:AKTx n=1 Tax=Hadrurus spadix TaxID=141984 RepID=A0A1W7RB27_9SCOR
MNTKLVLMMLMITAVILVSEAEADDHVRCVSKQQCTAHCKNKGCKSGECHQIKNRYLRCVCKQCGK